MHLRRRLRALFRRRRVEDEMAEEMRFHLEERAADLASRGLSDEEARYAAQRKFGNLGSLQERAREDRGWAGLDRALKELRQAVRQLAGNPGFTMLAIATLGLGIGANTSTFSVLNGVLLRPLPYPEPEGLDRFYRATPQKPNGHFSPADFIDLRRAQEGYGEVAAYDARTVSLAEPGRPAEMAYLSRATPNLFSLLGVAPQLGRDFASIEDTPGRDRVAILSQRTWQKRYGGRADIIGSTIRLDGEPHEVVGVLPATFNDWRHLGMVDIFRPLAFAAEEAADRQGATLRIVGRRSATRPPAESAGFVANLGARLAADFPDANAGSAWRVVPLRETALGRSGPAMIGMTIALSGFVLLIACSNLANLLLARTMARAREFAVRAALGASRLQLLRPLIVEALLLALAGGACAVLIACWFRDWAAVRSTGDNGEQVIFAVDWRVLGWAFGASLATAVAFGVAPALFALRLDLNQTLKSGGRGTTGGRLHRQFGRVLIVGQFALALVLLAGAGLFIRGLHDLNYRRSGWESERLVTGNFVLPAATYGDADKITAFHRRTLERLAALPGVATVSIAASTPFFAWPDVRKFIVDGRTRPPAGREPAAVVNRVSAGYFDAVGTSVRAGRAFTEHDDALAPRVYIVSEATARAWFGDANPLGRRIAAAIGGEPRWGEIVGVAADVRPAVEDPNPVGGQVYQPMAQDPQRPAELAVRTTVAPATVVESIRTAMAELDPDLPLRRLQHADATILRANYQLRVLRDMLAAIACLGLGLASLGIYGIIARMMAQRKGEFAIRLALGACVRDLARFVLATGVRLALVGSAFGLAGAYAVSRLIGAVFPEMDTGGALVLAATTLLLVGVALLACWLPARRAGQVDAMAVLRAE